MDLTAFHHLVLERCGIVFPDEKAALLEAGIEKRMATRQVPSPAAYFALVTASADEFDRLVDLVTVNETYFFREPAHLRLLSEVIAPSLLQSRPAEPVRVLSAGCSTGEEPYSVAIALAGKFGWTGHERFRITGIDVDTTALARAREGIYGRNAFRGEGWPCPDWMSKAFEAHGNDQYRVRRSIRDRVEFAHVNLLNGDFPSGFSAPDVIFYRNVSLYFPPDVKRAVFTRLANLLAPGGTLFLGSSETFFHDIGILTLDAVEGAFVFRKGPEQRAGRSSAALAATRLGGRGAARGDETREAGGRPANREAVRDPGTLGRPTSGSGPRPPAAVDEGVFDRAVAHAEAKEVEKALAVLTAVSPGDPGFLKAQTLKGCVLVNAGRLEEAREACSEALAVDGFCREAFLLLGIVAKLEDRKEEAIRRFREALYVDPSCWLAHFHLAELHAGRREHDRACQEYSVAIRLLERGKIADHGLSYFPLAFHAEHFITLCRRASARLAGSPPRGEERSHGV